MNYHIQMQSGYECDLDCSYCMHMASRIVNRAEGIPSVAAVTVDEYKAWRDACLSDADEILMEFHKGEPFFGASVDVLVDFATNTTNEKFRILTNGMNSSLNYERFFAVARGRVREMVVTYHRRRMAELPMHEHIQRKALFDSNLTLFKANCDRVIVREILFKNLKEQILENRDRLVAAGYEFEIVPYAGTYDAAYKSVVENEAYTSEDIALMTTSVHTENPCQCRSGYHSIMIQSIPGYTAHRGDVLRCWQDMKLVGSVIDLTFDKNASYDRNTGKVTTTNPPPVYRWDEQP